MRLIAGLGNPGLEHADNRHNIGFKAVEAMANGKLKKSAQGALVKEFKIDGHACLAVQPLTYMNASGQAIEALIKYHKIDLQDILVIYDDMDLPLGTLRVRASGSAGGHNGIKSIIEHVGSNHFTRLRLGVGRPKSGLDPVDYVLGNFTSAEKKLLPEFINQALLCVHSWVTEGVEQAMNQFNKRGTKNE